ncbi:MAG: N-6 DNA methylase [Chloroflexi bacterium]|nr:N-6 DNA methylase [Chloroflexota bacterium]
MKQSEFSVHFEEYKASIEAARAKKAHHDQLRSIFVGFLSKAFGVKYDELELEKGVQIAKVKGYIDALYQDVIFEFKRDLATERDKGIQELTGYLKSLAGATYFGILTDGLTFEVYALRDSKLSKIDSIFLCAKNLTVEAAFTWFDAFLFSEKEITPSSNDIVTRFGDTSAVFNLSSMRLSQMALSSKSDPTYKVKFDEWDKLLAKAYGHSVARDELFVRHTYLSILAKLIAYTALYKGKPKGNELKGILTGKAFINLNNLAEEDFFCWILRPSLETEALELVQGLAQHLSVYDMSKVNADLLKELYENLVDAETKHDLGEVYTPDWLVELTLREVGFKPGQRLLDPACGSGTFLFTAIQMFREQGLAGEKLVDESLDNIVGVDVHPLAITIAKVNYILALSPDLSAYSKNVVLPVYMSNSLEGTNPTNGQLVPISVGGKEYFNIPTSMAESPASLDKIIDEMGKFTTGDPDVALGGFSSFLESQGLDDYIAYWRSNLKLMRKLVKQGRDTIWTFILKNYYRPAYLSRNRFDIVAGNPPWLSYRFITEPDYQAQVKRLILSYGLLGKKDVKLFTHMELATLFYVLSTDAYLKKDGVISFVMPRSVLTGSKQHKHFQEFLQSYQLPPTYLRSVIDVEGVSPLFKVPACVLISKKYGKAEPVVVTTLDGKLKFKNCRWGEAKAHLTISAKKIRADKLFLPAPTPSEYLKHMKEGATLVPRSLWFVQPIESIYGMNQAKPALETHPEAERTAKKPWLNIHLEGEVEAQYLYATMLGRQLLPFGYTELGLVVLPMEDKPTGLSMVNKEMALGRGHSGLKEWLVKAEKLWDANKKKGNKSTVYDWLDYVGKLTSQHPTGFHTVLYNRAGTNLASCVIPPKLSKAGLTFKGFAADADTYYYQTKDPNEAHYLCAFLNAAYVDQAIKPHQTKGQWGERDIHRRPFEYVPIPKFDCKDGQHQKLAELSKNCHQTVKGMKLEGNSIGHLRGKVRKALSQELSEIDDLVQGILKPKL